MQSITTELAPFEDAAPCATRPLELVVPIRLRLVELALVENDADRVRREAASLRRDARKLLTCSPYKSFAWLVLFWGRTVEGDLGEADFELLRLSLRTAPHEGWISRRRNQVALTVWDRLPEDLKERTLDEFGALVRSTYIDEAARIFVEVAPQPARDRIVDRLAGLPEETRTDFTERVEALGDGEVALPGDEPTGPP